MGENIFQRQISYDYQGDVTVARFTAMASPCEVLVESQDILLVQHAAKLVAHEAWRIEKKFSRYREDSVLAHIHSRQGQAIEVDEETTSLLNFASQCFEISDGLFDITSGVLREIWSFKAPISFPEADQIKAYRQRIGWEKVGWSPPYLNLPIGMQIDFGGIGKEYALDRTAMLLSDQLDVSFLINLGGDLFANRAMTGNRPWLTGIEDPNNVERAVQALQLRQGALATSGDVRQHFTHNGKRYGHILNPKTAKPVEDSPRSITVAAAKCTDAGFLSTLAMLQGAEAEEFLTAQELPYWCLW